MGQASDYFFAPLPLSQSNNAEMPKKGCQTDRDSLTSAHSQTASPALLPLREAEDQDVPNNEYPGSSIFRGLGELLYSVLLLGALHAKERYLDASTQTKDADDDIDTVSQCSDGTLIGGDGSSDGSAAMTAVAMEGESDSTNPSEAEDPSLRGAYELVSVARSDSDEIISPSFDGNPSLQDAAGDFEAKVVADGRIVEEMPVDLAMSAGRPPPRTGHPDLTATRTPPRDRQGSVTHSTAQLLFHSFSRPLVYPTETSAEQLTSVNYDELQPPIDDTDQSTGTPSSQFPSDMSDFDSEDEETDTIHKSKGPRLMKSARKFLIGQYHGKKSPVRVRTANLVNVDDPPIQTVSAARKPMVVRSPVRQHSYQPTMSDATESGDYLCDGGRDEDDEFLAPFNRLERRTSL
ncbi:MAG: hypothetical protein Q9184_005680 [Pyrenodesmia sp. 2 TL-2023]